MQITNGNIHSARLVDFLQPFIKKLVVSNDGREIAHIKKFIFTHLIKQSDLGLEYQAKYDAWRQVSRFEKNLYGMEVTVIQFLGRLSGNN